MKKYRLVSIDTREVLPRILKCSEKQLATNVPAGYEAVETIGTEDTPPLAERKFESELHRRIAAIEEKAGPRAVREALLVLLPDGAVKQRLQEFETEIAEHRKELTGEA
jgi:hypothetical protein